jgi:hypothetical protein
MMQILNCSVHAPDVFCMVGLIDSNIVFLFLATSMLMMYYF